MNCSILDIEPTQVTVELVNESAYESPGEVKVCVRKKAAPEPEISTIVDKNVFTIEGLVPDTEYEIAICAAGDLRHGTESDRKHAPGQTDMAASDETPDNRGPVTFTTGSEQVRLDIRRFGAAGDGEHDDTAAVQAAIMACPEAGTVYFGKGTYLCGPIFLKSDIRIWLDEGAVILGSTERSDYPILPGIIRGDEYYSVSFQGKRSDEESPDRSDCNFGSWEGNPLSCHASLITGIGIKNVKIYGRGVIDGNAQNSDWWIDPKIKRDAWRPNLIFLNRCKDVTLQGVTLRNSPSWTVHPYYSDDISILGLTILNPDDSPNTDGIDPDSCSNVSIIGTDISVGDDCIAIKSGKIYMAKEHYKTMQNITVRNCRLNHGHGSVTIGSECACGVSEVHADRCIFNETDRGLRIKTRRGRGNKAVIEGILFENIVMNRVKMPFCVNMFYFCDPDGHSEYCQCKEALPVDDLTPEIRDITARNITCAGVDVSLLAAYGLPEKKAGCITLENIKADYLPETERTPAVPIMMDGLEEMSGAGIFARNVEKLVLKNVHLSGCADTGPDVQGIGEMITGQDEE